MLPEKYVISKTDDAHFMNLYLIFEARFQYDF